MPDKDVLGKADALLRRHSLPLPGSGSDTGGVPVLTDLVEPQPPAAPELEGAVLERVVQEVQARIASDLERNATQQLAGQVRAAVAAALGEMRPELARIIGEAVRQELERRQVK